jgi:hypothetical protein
VPSAGAALVGAAEVGAAVDRGAPVEDDVVFDVVFVEGTEDSESFSPVAVALVGELSAPVLAGADVEGVDGVVGVVPWCEDALVSSPRVVVLDESELPTIADTGLSPRNSIPVTMPMAMTKTATA